MGKRVAILGLGLIGGSICKALQRTGGFYCIGYNRNKTVADAALADGAIQEIWDGNSALDAELVILSFSPQVCVDFLEKHAVFFQKNCVVTDVCGVKERLVRDCSRICGVHSLRFVGGHPMAGREFSGYANALGTLFDNASYILTPDEHTYPDALETLRTFATALGCGRITVTDPALHDQMIAYTSQLPHVLAGAYVKSPAQENHIGFSAGSYKDVSRVAAVDENLWTELFLTNAENLCGEIDLLITHLQQYREALTQKNAPALHDLIAEGRVRKQTNL